MATSGIEPGHVRATARYVHVAPDKARQVIAHIRGARVADARRRLQLSPKGVAEQILKTLDSAVANAEHNNDLDPDELVVTAAIVDEGPTLKRFQPRAMGRAYRVRKRTSHITIAVAVGDERPQAAAEGKRRGARVPRRKQRDAQQGQSPSAATAAPGTQEQE